MFGKEKMLIENPELLQSGNAARQPANLLDSRIETAATPAVNYTTPRIVSAGIRISSGR